MRLALDSSNRDNARVSAIGLEFELHSTVSAGSCVSLCLTFGVRMEATDGGQSKQAGALRAARQGGRTPDGIILRGEEEREYSEYELVGH